MPPSSTKSTPSPKQRLFHILQTITPTKSRSISEPLAHTTTPTPPIPGPNTWKALPPLPPLETHITPPTLDANVTADPSPVTPQSVRALRSPHSFSQPLPPSLARRPETPRSPPSPVSRSSSSALTRPPVGAEPGTQEPQPPTRKSDPAEGAWWKPSSSSPTTPTDLEPGAKQRKKIELALEELRAFVEMADGEADAGGGDAVRYAARLVERAVDVCEGCGMG